MFDGLIVADHTVAAGSRVLAPKNCENCRKPFLRKIESDAKFCNPCRAMYAGILGNQIWHCIECGTQRSWGDGTPLETTGKLLLCNHCAKVTSHEFSRMANAQLRTEYHRQNLVSARDTLR